MVTKLQQSADQRADQLRAKLAVQLQRLIDDAGLSHRELARAAGVSRAFIDRILAGKASPTHQTYARLGAALGADFGVRYYVNTGPPIRDRHQARMVEHNLAVLHGRWTATPEVIVYRPARGVIDLTLHDPAAGILIADEHQSELRRLEQQVRWHRMKAEALPSSKGFETLAGGTPTIGRLLVVRRTRANLTIAAEFAEQLRAAYPEHPADALASLVGDARWPGDALIWMTLGSRGAQFCDDRAPAPPRRSTKTTGATTSPKTSPTTPKATPKTTTSVTTPKTTPKTTTKRTA